jgi:hypothetical protein
MHLATYLQWSNSNKNHAFGGGAALLKWRIVLYDVIGARNDQALCLLEKEESQNVGTQVLEGPRPE